MKYSSTIRGMTRRRTLRSVRSPSSPSPEDFVVNEVIIDLLSDGFRPAATRGGIRLLLLGFLSAPEEHLSCELVESDVRHLTDEHDDDHRRVMRITSRPAGSGQELTSSAGRGRSVRSPRT